MLGAGFFNLRTVLTGLAFNIGLAWPNWPDCFRINVKPIQKIRQLTRNQFMRPPPIIRSAPPPATEMPHFDKYAYEDKSCYGLSADEPRTKNTAKLQTTFSRRSSEDDYCSPSAEKPVEECERNS